MWWGAQGFTRSSLLWKDRDGCFTAHMSPAVPRIISFSGQTVTQPALSNGSKVLTSPSGKSWWDCLQISNTSRTSRLVAVWTCTFAKVFTPSWSTNVHLIEANCCEALRNGLPTWAKRKHDLLYYKEREGETLGWCQTWIKNPRVALKQINQAIMITNKVNANFNGRLVQLGKTEGKGVLFRLHINFTLGINSSSSMSFFESSHQKHNNNDS